MILPYIAHSLLGITHTLALPHFTLPLASIMDTQPKPGNGNPFTDLQNMVTFLEGYITAIGGGIFVIGVSVAGIMRMVAFGSERRIATSNIALTAAVVGLVIMLLGSALLSVFQNVFQ
ncbi:MAG TPA: hypothetical protein VKV37_20350 [Ktedonobacteraceae bacterium]|jgi:hypothetical protein|nr:hypothetical protein [Ktedonobacteraceae bacterium]